ncbi:hypothetical protein ABBQ32_013353 [Trebouxia sp. C0010 RCD-2024]
MDKECVLIRSHKDYADMIAFVKEMAANIDKPTDDVIHTEVELRRGQNAGKEAEARLLEAEARKLEAEARKLEAEARKLEAEAAVKKADIEMLKYQN